MKKGKEMKVDSFKNYKVVYGSVNNKNPKALYINVSAWAEPKIEGEINYNRVIRDIDKRVRQALYNSLAKNITSPFYKDKTIVDFDIRESGVKFGKRSFVSCDVTFYMKYEIPVNSDILRPSVNSLINEIIKSALEPDRNFKFYKKKR